VQWRIGEKETTRPPQQFYPAAPVLTFPSARLLLDPSYSAVRTLGLASKAGYTLPMKRATPLIALMFLASLPSAMATDPPLVDGVSGAPIVWSDWVAKRGPVAVLVWASWAPDAETTMDRYQELVAACRDSGLHLIVLDVQESLEDGRKALGSREVGWLHDRYGGLLKLYRVIEVPSLLLVAADGTALAKFDATAAAIRGWSGP
jgi:hypothetical protein